MIIEVCTPYAPRRSRIKDTDIEMAMFLSDNPTALFNYLVASTKAKQINEQLLMALLRSRSEYASRVLVACAAWLIERCNLPKNHFYIALIEKRLLDLGPWQKDYGWNLVRFCSEVYNSAALRHRIFSLKDSIAVYQYAWDFGYVEEAAKRVAKCDDDMACEIRLRFCARIGYNKELIDALRRDLDDLEAKLDNDGFVRVNRYAPSVN